MFICRLYVCYGVVEKTKHLLCLLNLDSYKKKYLIDWDTTAKNYYPFHQLLTA